MMMGFLQKVEALKIKLKRDAQNVGLTTLADFLYEVKLEQNAPGKHDEKWMTPEERVLFREALRKGLIKADGKLTIKGIDFVDLKKLGRRNVRTEAGYQKRVQDLAKKVFINMSADDPEFSTFCCDAVMNLDYMTPGNLDVREFLENGGFTYTVSPQGGRTNWRDKFSDDIMDEIKKLWRAKYGKKVEGALKVKLKRDGGNLGLHDFDDFMRDFEEHGSMEAWLEAGLPWLDRHTKFLEDAQRKGFINKKDQLTKKGGVYIEKINGLEIVRTQADYRRKVKSVGEGILQMALEFNDSELDNQKIELKDFPQSVLDTIDEFLYDVCREHRDVQNYLERQRGRGDWLGSFAGAVFTEAKHNWAKHFMKGKKR